MHGCVDCIDPVRHFGRAEIKAPDIPVIFLAGVKERLFTAIHIRFKFVVIFPADTTKAAGHIAELQKTGNIKVK